MQRFMSLRRVGTAAVFLLLVATLAAPNPALAVDHVWVGAGLNNNWSDVGNWNGFLDPPLSGLNVSRIIFFGATGRTTAELNNNYSINELLFSPDTVFNTHQAYTLQSGSNRTLTIGSGGITNFMNLTQTINHAVSIGADQSWML